MNDLDFMARAIELAARGRLKVQPNPMVGCVIVKNNKIIGEGWHKEYGKDHAEINAIKNCKRIFGAKKALKLIAGSNVYVNLEPCSIEKNTPPCSNALIEYQIKRLFCGTLDPNPKINGRGIKLLKKAGIETSVGLLKNECEELNRVFFTNQKKSRPYIILKSAQSLDGRIALKNGESNWISNPQSRKKTKNVEYLKYKKKNFLEEFLQDLLDRNISSILVEGGQKTLNAFLVNNLFDELVLYTAPMFLGKESKDAISVKAPDKIKTSLKLQMMGVEKFKDDIKTTYYNKDI